jgi:hypothetical protein
MLLSLLHCKYFAVWTESPKLGKNPCIRGNKSEISAGGGGETERLAESLLLNVNIIEYTG